MIKAVADGKDGRKMLVLGLSAMNVERLQQDQPIYFDLGALRIKDTDRVGGVTIFYGKDEAALTRTLREFIGPQTEVIAVPRGDERPT